MSVAPATAAMGPPGVSANGKAGWDVGESLQALLWYNSSSMLLDALT